MANDQYQNWEPQGMGGSPGTFPDGDFICGHHYKYSACPFCLRGEQQRCECQSCYTLRRYRPADRSLQSFELQAQPQHSNQDLTVQIPHFSPSHNASHQFSPLSTTTSASSHSSYGYYTPSHQQGFAQSPISPPIDPMSPSQTGGSYQWPVPRPQVGSTAGTSAAILLRTKEPSFFCEVPGCQSQGFTERHNLNYHMRSHQGSKPHVCIKCNRGFTSSSDLSRHYKSKKPCDERNAKANYFLTPN